MINKTIIVGNVGQDPEVRYLDDGTPVANFSVATSERWKNKDGEKMESTEWHSVVAWRNLATIVEQWVKRGNQVYIEGKMKTRSWEKDGVKHYKTELYANDLKMLGRKPDEANNQKTENQVAKFDEMPGATAGDPGAGKDDLPF